MGTVPAALILKFRYGMARDRPSLPAARHRGRPIPWRHHRLRRVTAPLSKSPDWRRCRTVAGRGIVDPCRRRGSGDCRIVGRLLAFRGSLEQYIIGNIGCWAGYAGTWRLVRRRPPLWKKAHQISWAV